MNPLFQIVDSSFRYLAVFHVNQCSNKFESLQRIWTQQQGIVKCNRSLSGIEENQSHPVSFFEAFQVPMVSAKRSRVNWFPFAKVFQFIICTESLSNTKISFPWSIIITQALHNASTSLHIMACGEYLSCYTLCYMFDENSRSFAASIHQAQLSAHQEKWFLIMDKGAASIHISSKLSSMIIYGLCTLQNIPCTSKSSDNCNCFVIFVKVGNA